MNPAQRAFLTELVELFQKYNIEVAKCDYNKMQFWSGSNYISFASYDDETGTFNEIKTYTSEFVAAGR